MMKAALFDLDGVIFDTEPQYSLFWGSQCRLYFPDRPGLENTIKGQTLVQIYESLFSDLPEEQPKIRERLNDFERNMQYDYVRGVEAFLADLRRNAVQTAIVTSSDRLKMENVYRAHPELASWFDAIVTAEHCQRSKPFPDCYLKGAELLGCRPEECFGFEDSFNGLRAVRAAGMTVVGLATTNPRDAIEPLADVVVGDFRELSYNKIADLSL